MSSLSLRLPDSLHDKVRELAERDDVSINQFIATAIAEKAAALLTLEYLEERAGRSDAKVFDRILGRVPDVAPVRGDELPRVKGSSNKSARRTPSRRSAARRRR